MRSPSTSRIITAIPCVSAILWRRISPNTTPRTHSWISGRSIFRKVWIKLPSRCTFSVRVQCRRQLPDRKQQQQHRGSRPDPEQRNAGGHTERRRIPDGQSLRQDRSFDRRADAHPRIHIHPDGKRRRSHLLSVWCIIHQAFESVYHTSLFVYGDPVIYTAADCGRSDLYQVWRGNSQLEQLEAALQRYAQGNYSQPIPVEQYTSSNLELIAALSAQIGSQSDGQKNPAASLCPTFLTNCVLR